MPTILREGRYRFFFFSNEGFEPAHVHVESDREWAKFWLEPIQLADAAGYNSSELSKLRRLVEKHQGVFLEKWNEHFRR